MSTKTMDEVRHELGVSHIAPENDSFQIDSVNSFQGNPNEIEEADPADADAATGVMIALLPIISDWCKIELPHLTLVYCGTTDKLKPTDFNELAKDASMLAAMNPPLTLSVQGIKKFGNGEEQVLGLDIQPSPQLWAMRRAVEEWNASEYKLFDPHCTIGPIGTPVPYIPRAVAFDRVYVGWGDDNLTFNLKGSVSRY
jgi:2'-5' RNA ligase